MEIVIADSVQDVRYVTTQNETVEPKRHEFRPKRLMEKKELSTVYVVCQSLY